MPSPFPGMDPYLEDPVIWPDFHHRWATILSEELNAQLPAPYYARLEMRPELAIVEETEDSARRIVPDVLVLRSAEGVARFGQRERFGDRCAAA